VSGNESATSCGTNQSNIDAINVFGSRSKNDNNRTPPVLSSTSSTFDDEEEELGDEIVAAAISPIEDMTLTNSDDNYLQNNHFNQC
jgi:hypothetical protein